MERALILLSTAFFVTLFLPGMPVVNNVFTAALFIFSFFYSPVREKLPLLKQRREIQLMLAFFALHIISTIASHDKHEALTLLALRAPLLIFPLSIGLLYIPPASQRRILQYYGYVVTFAALFCLVYGLIIYARSGDAVYLYNDSLTMPLKMQSSYFSLMVTLAVFGWLYLLGAGFLKGRDKGFGQLCILLLLVVHFMLASRISMVVLYLGLILVGVRYIIKGRKIVLGLTLLGGLMAAVLACVIFLPKTINRWRELQYSSYTITSEAAEAHYNGTLTPEQWNGANIRLAIWKCGWQLGQDHWLTGVQLGDKQDALMQTYKENGFDFAYRNRRNMHNLYLDIFTAFGIIGLGIFVAGFLILPIHKAVRTADWLELAIILTFACSMLVESLFDRSLGCLLTAYFFSFIAAGRPLTRYPSYTGRSR